jgi:Kef-type K+ transport system membrane component KefB
VLVALAPHLETLAAALSGAPAEATPDTSLGAIAWTAVGSAGWALLKLGLLTLGGLLFARFLERPFTHTLKAIQPRADTMLIVLGVGLVVAGTAALLGFPLAIGGFLAGLVFSRDPVAVRLDASFDSLYDLFVPFFFLGIGLAVNVNTLGPALAPASLLLGAAVLGKGAGTFLPACALMPTRSAGLLAIGLLPRSEITLVVIERGLNVGVVPPRAFTWMVLVVVATMVGVPLLLRLLLAGGGAAPTQTRR